YNQPSAVQNICEVSNPFAVWRGGPFLGCYKKSTRSGDNKSCSFTWVLRRNVSLTVNCFHVSSADVSCSRFGAKNSDWTPLLGQIAFAVKHKAVIEARLFRSRPVRVSPKGGGLPRQAQNSLLLQKNSLGEPGEPSYLSLCHFRHRRLGRAELFRHRTLANVHALIHLGIAGRERHHALDHLILGAGALDDEAVMVGLGADGRRALGVGAAHADHHAAALDV